MDKYQIELMTSLFEQIPGRAKTAFAALEFCKSLTDPCQCNINATGRPLTGPERALYLASLDAIRQYVAGETDMGGPRAVGGYDAETLLDEVRAQAAKDAKEGESKPEVGKEAIAAMVRDASSIADTGQVDQDGPDRTEKRSDGPGPPTPPDDP